MTWKAMVREDSRKVLTGRYTVGGSGNEQSIPQTLSQHLPGHTLWGRGARFLPSLTPRYLHHPLERSVLTLGGEVTLGRAEPPNCC